MTRDQYHAYLQSEQWQRVAEARKRIDGYRCQMCGSRGTQLNPLQVHHMRYYGVIGHEFEGENLYVNLVTLCDSCHKAVHRMMNRTTSADGRHGWRDSVSYADHVLETRETVKPFE